MVITVRPAAERTTALALETLLALEEAVGAMFKRSWRIIITTAQETYINGATLFARFVITYLPF